VVDDAQPARGTRRRSRVAGALDNPKLTAPDKASLVLSIAGDRLDASGRNFVRVLVDADRFGVLPQIRTLFEALKNDTDGVSEGAHRHCLSADRGAGSRPQGRAGKNASAGRSKRRSASTRRWAAARASLSATP
jgi:hypothetical protein